MGAGLLTVKSGFILINRIYQFSTINSLKRERERISRTSVVMTQGEFVCFGRGLDDDSVPECLRVRDILEWEQGCWPFKSGFISFH